MSLVQQTIRFEASPAAVYDALMQSEQHSAFTGAKAEIDASAGGAWSAYDGKIFGHTLELVANERIVQSWRAGNWPAGVYSVAHFELAADGEGTTVSLTHDALPEAEGAHIDGGWHKMYWDPLAAYLAER